MKSEIAKSVAIVCAEYEITLDKARADIWMTSLEPYGALIVAKAVTMLLRDPQTGKYGKPRINDLLAKCELVSGGDGRPGSDEAWSVAIRAADEANTVIWTEETAQAFYACQRLLSGRGEETAARMAFKDVYNRLVVRARSEGRQRIIQTSLGTDAVGREQAIKDAQVAGLLSNEVAEQFLLPHFGQIETQSNHEKNMAKLREELAKLKSPEEKLAEASARTAFEARIMTEHRKAQLEEMTCSADYRQ